MGRHRSGTAAWRIWVTVPLVASVVLAACGDTPSVDLPPAVDPDDPAATLQQLLDALADDRLADTAAYVDEDQLALLTFLDGTPPQRVAAMIEGEVPADVRVAFWGTFADSVAATSGESIGRLEVGEQSPVGDGDTFVSVDTTIGATGLTSPWVLRATDRGWQVDLLATFGGVFAPNLWVWSETLSEGNARQVILDAIVTYRPSLTLARQRGEGRLPDEAIEALERLETR